MIPFPFVLFEKAEVKTQLLGFESYTSNHRSGKLVVTFMSQPAEQPTSGSLVIQRGECARLHNPGLAGGRSLQPRTAQLARVVGGRKKFRVGKWTE